MALGKVVSIFSCCFSGFLCFTNSQLENFLIAISRTAWNTVMDFWLCLKMESIMSTHNCTFVAEGECWFARITTKLSPCFNIPTEANDTIALLTATPVSLYMATAHSYFGAFLIEWGSSPKRVKALKEIVPRYQ